MIPHIATAPAADVDALHAATLRLLEEVGVRFPVREAQAALAGAGAVVNAETGVVKIPPDLVERALTGAPRAVVLAGRDPATAVACGAGEATLTLDGTGAYTLDHHTGERRSSTMADLGDALRVADAVPEIGIVWNIVSASDAAPDTQVLHELWTCLRSTGKHVQGEVQRAEEVPYVMEMVAAASDAGAWDPARPIFSIVYCPVPPLQHEPQMLEAAMLLAGEGVPICIYSMGLTGATAPIALAGAVAQANAEILSSLVLFQLLRPGLPCIYVADTGVLDMRTGAYAAASPEAVLITQAMAGLARRYGLPVMATGLTCDANAFTYMSGGDAALTALPSLLLAPDLLCGAGMLDGAQMLSLPKILLDAELYRACRRVLAGMTVDDEHLMLDLVAEVGPGGHFLGARRTRSHLRAGGLYTPGLMLREPFDAWAQAREDEVSRAAAAVDRILETHRPRPLPAGADAHVAGLLADAARELPAR